MNCSSSSDSSAGIPVTEPIGGAIRKLNNNQKPGMDLSKLNLIRLAKHPLGTPLPASISETTGKSDSSETDFEPASLSEGSLSEKNSSNITPPNVTDKLQQATSPRPSSSTKNLAMRSAGNRFSNRTQSVVITGTNRQTETRTTASLSPQSSEQASDSVSSDPAISTDDSNSSRSLFNATGTGPGSEKQKAINVKDGDTSRSRDANTQTVSSSDSAGSAHSSVCGVGPPLSTLVSGTVAEDVTVVVTRVYPTVYEAMMKTKVGQLEEIETRLLNPACHHALLTEDERCVSYSRPHAMNAIRRGLEEKMFPAKRYSLDHLNQTLDFSAESIQAEAVAALLNENDETCERIMSNIPPAQLGVIQETVLRINNTVEAAVLLETDQRMWAQRKMTSSRPLTILKGLQLIEDGALDDEDVEIYIYDTLRIEEQQVYKFTGFMATKRSSSRTRLTSNISFKVERVSEVFVDNPDLKRIDREIPVLKQQLMAQIPLHGEVDVTAKILNISPPTKSRPEHLIQFDTEGYPPQNACNYLLLCCGNYEHNNFDLILQPGNVIQVKNVRWVKKRPLLIADHLSEFNLIETPSTVMENQAKQQRLDNNAGSKKRKRTF